MVIALYVTAAPVAEKSRLSRHIFRVAKVAQTNAGETKALLQVQASTAPKGELRISAVWRAEF